MSQPHPSSNYTPGQLINVKVDGQVVQAKYISWYEAYQMPLVEYKGKRIPRKDLGARPGATPLPTAQPSKRSRFSVNQRFDYIETMVDMTITKENVALVITGSGGLGKSFTVSSRLKAAGLIESKPPTAEEDAIAGDYIVIKGYSTAKALYRMLYENREKVVVFDDCDSVLDNETAVMLLKGALDSYEERWISWLAESFKDEDDLPRTFRFDGQVIFISNRTLNQVDQAILSRCLYVDVSMTSEEKIDRIRALAPSMAPKLTPAEKEDCIALLDLHRDSIGDLNIRTFLKVASIRATKRPNWADIAEYQITAM